MEQVNDPRPRICAHLPASLTSDERTICLLFWDAVIGSGPTIVPNDGGTTTARGIRATSTAVLSGNVPPIFALQCAYAKAWKALPEHAKCGTPSPILDFVEEVHHQVKHLSSDLVSLFPINDNPALISANTQETLTHRNLASFIRHFALRSTEQAKRLMVAIGVPNGPLLALAILAVASHYTAFPISVACGPDQFQSDVDQSGCDILLIAESEVKRLLPQVVNAGSSTIDVMVLQPAADLTFSVTALDGTQIQTLTTNASVVNAGPNDYALMLFTSGTSGTKKVVPITTHALVAGVAFVIESWGLTPDDCCLNMMPLFHVGGIVRNLLAPILAGGSTICCPAFDANSFWDLLEERSPTWYYASPTMHQMILDVSAYRQDSLSNRNIRLIANAAGGLLPSLARSLRETFKCVVLPSYGMTECMPISSPPMTYQLDRPGTSGSSAGPEVGILDAHGNLLSHGALGRIAVRGAPLFDGYFTSDGRVDRSSFTADGWFDTGDLGNLDTDGYLYITGRSKEVINRGGELISPFEVEEAVLSAAQRPGSAIEGRVSAVLAFSVPHDLLQEVVGAVIVTPPDTCKVDIKAVQDSVGESLSQMKWPQVIVFMEDLPKNNGKVQRIRLSARMNIPELQETTPLSDRHFGAFCPPPNSLLSDPIETHPVYPDLDLTSHVLADAVGPNYDVYVKQGSIDGYPVGYVARAADLQALSNIPADLDPLSMITDQLDDLDLPVIVHLLDDFLPVDKCGDIDEEMLDHLTRTIPHEHDFHAGHVMTTLEAEIAKLFADILMCSPNALTRTTDFFEKGGDSMKAGRLLSQLRKITNTRIPIDVLFINGQISDLAQYIERNSAHRATALVRGEAARDHVTSRTCSSTNVLLLLLQLTPMILAFPMKRALSWTIFLYVMAASQSWVTCPYLIGRLFNLVIALAVGRLCVRIVAPIVGILVKWTIIGRFREGLYPMWGLYHTRWWIVQKTLALCGRGVFGMTNTGLVLYYRLLGARIGTNVTIAPAAQLGEYDLITIGDGTNLDRCVCRPFGVERNTAMYLGRISIGANASIGLNAIIAPGTAVPDTTCIGPNSSSWELQDADESNRTLSPSKIPGAHLLSDLIISYPVLALVSLARAMPWIAGLFEIVRIEAEAQPDEVLTVLNWFSVPYRIGFHYLAQVLHALFGPLAWFLAAVFVKKTIDSVVGKLRPGPADKRRNQAQKLRISVLKRIIPPSWFHQLVELFGTHYDVTSAIYRAFGAKVGRRVYWPGTGPSVQDFDLIDVGDDVVFGSRSHIVTSDGSGSDKVTIASGAMIADRVVLLPGTSIGRNTVLGSGALTRRNIAYPHDTVWVGARQGEAICLAGNRPKHAEDRDKNPQIHGHPGRQASVVSQETFNTDLTAATPKDFDVECWMASRQTDMNDIALVASLRRKSSYDSAATLVNKQHLESPMNLQPVQSTWSRATSPDMLQSASTKHSPVGTPALSPFGRAFHKGQASYVVVGLPLIIIYSMLTTAITTFYWNVPATSAVQMIAVVLPDVAGYSSAFAYSFRPLLIYFMFTGIISILQTGMAILALSAVVLAKWLLLGRRKPGNYDWDKSSYCQRWQLYLTIEQLRRKCYGGHGILNLLTGTHWLVLYYRLLGAKIGKDCALFANGSPSCLLTEPDLLVMGDRVAVDDASLVAHINSRGVFDLNELHVGSGSVLRSGSRLLSGARMGPDAVLMEHTLVMAGDEVAQGTVRQGWPSEEWEGKRMPTIDADGIVVPDNVKTKSNMGRKWRPFRRQKAVKDS